MRVKTTQRRDAILNTAVEVFREKGFELTTMSEITERVGGSKATLYNYFPSKEVLFTAVMHRLAEEDIQRIFNELDEEKPLHEALCLFGMRFISFTCQHSVIASLRVLYAESGRSTIGQLFYEMGPEKGTKQIAAYLKVIMERGELMRADADIAAQQLIALLRAEVFEVLMLGVKEIADFPCLESIVERSVNTFLRAYRSI